MKQIKLFLILGILLILSSIAWADIPNLINFQGILDSAGNPLANKTKSVEFKIYNAPVGGTVLWSVTQSVTTDEGGLFNLMLGSDISNPLPDSVFDDTSLWLGMKVGTDAEMTPRQQIVSNAFGFRVGSVDGAKGGKIIGDLVVSPPNPSTGGIYSLGVQGVYGAVATYLPGETDVDPDSAAFRFTSKIDSLLPAVLGLRINNNGNVSIPNKLGIGTIKPQAHLEIIADDTSSAGCQIFSSAQSLWSLIEAFVIGDSSGIEGSINSCTIYGDGRVKITPRADLVSLEVRQGRAPTQFSDIFKVRDTTGTKDYLRVASSGDVLVPSKLGIGTASPGNQLHIFKSSGNPTMRLETPNTATATTFQMGRTDNFWQLTTTGVTQDNFILANQQAGGSYTNRLVIDPTSGNVGIGTTSPGAKLSVVKGSNANTVYVGDEISFDASDGRTQVVVGSSAGPYAGTVSGQDANHGLFVGWAYNGTVANAYGLIDTWAGNNKLVINPTGGNVGIGTTSPTHPLHMGSGAHCTAAGVWTNASSKAYKTDIQALKDSEYSDILEKLEQINVVRFKYKVEPTKEHIGLIAEDVPDEIASDDRKGIPTADAIGFLMAALKAQQTEIESLKQMLKQLQDEQSEK